MPSLAPAYFQLHPSYTMPELIVPYAQASGAFDTLFTGDVLPRLSEDDLAIYINRIDVRTRMSAGQAAYNNLPSVSVVASQISTATYQQRVRAIYDHHDVAAAARRQFSLVQAQRLGMRQGHFQLARTALLQGYNPANGEGLLNTNGATAINLPADPYGNTTLVTYDNGYFAFFLAQQVGLMKQRTNQLGIGHKFVFLGPQRAFAPFEYNVVQLVQYQRPGAGSTSTVGTVKHILMDNGDEVIWAYDDTLIGQGAGGNDAILLVMPELVKPEGDQINTNVFADLAPNLLACTLQLCDKPAPTEIPVPIPGGGVDVLSEMRLSSGWAPRPEAVTIISAKYQ